MLREVRPGQTFGETINALRGKATIILIAHNLPASIGELETIELGR